MVAGACFSMWKVSVPQLCSLYNFALLLDLRIECIFFFFDLTYFDRRKNRRKLSIKYLFLGFAPFYLVVGCMR